MKIPQLMLIHEGEGDPCFPGLSGLQLREKTLEARELLERAERLRAETRLLGIFFTINDRIDVAIAVDADGVHLPEAGISPRVARRLKPSLIIGVSTHSLKAAERAEAEGADYVIFGPIYETPSKEAFGSPQGCEKLAEVARRLKIPVIAIGGITLERRQACLDAGAHGIATRRFIT